MLIQTRARKLKESKKQEDRSIAIPVREPESKHEAENNLEKEHEVGITHGAEPETPTEKGSETVDSQTNRVFVGDSILNGTLPRENYLKLLNSKFDTTHCIKILMIIVKYALRKMKVELTETLLEAEAWRIMVRTSQKLFPAKVRKGFPEKMIHNIRVVQFRLDPQKMSEHYDTRYLPVLGKGDPLAIKMTRDNHVEKSLLQDIHLPCLLNQTSVSILLSVLCH